MTLCINTHVKSSNRTANLPLIFLVTLAEVGQVMGGTGEVQCKSGSYDVTIQQMSKRLVFPDNKMERMDFIPTWTVYRSCRGSRGNIKKHS